MSSQVLHCMIPAKKGDCIKVNVHTDTGGIKVDTNMWIVKLKSEKYNSTNDIITRL